MHSLMYDLVQPLAIAGILVGTGLMADKLGGEESPLAADVAEEPVEEPALE